jgi:class I fructose-bisphosphate aldolase
MATVTKGSLGKLEEILGADAADLLGHKCNTVPASQLHLPGHDFVDRVWKDSDRPTRVLRSLQSLFEHGRLAGTGYLSILPVDQGIEHTAGSSFAPNPIYFDGEKIVELAIEGNIPFICKINHNELLTYPTKYDQVLFGTVKEAWELGAVALGATVYFGSPESDRQLQEIAVAFHAAHELGMATVLWCYLRNSSFKKDGVNYETAADLTGQANHLGVTIEADIIKQKLADTNRGFEVIGFGKTAPGMYDKLATDHPIDLCRYQVINCYMGRAGLINSGGESHGESDLKEAVRTAVINKRAGGMGLISGRKSFQRPMKEGVELLHAIQDVYLNPTVTIA